MAVPKDNFFNEWKAPNSRRHILDYKSEIKNRRSKLRFLSLLSNNFVLKKRIGKFFNTMVEIRSEDFQKQKLLLQGIKNN